MPRHAAQEGTKRGRGSVHLVVMGAVGKGAELVDKGLVPITRDQLNEPVLALRGKGISAPFLVALFALGADGIAPQLPGEIGGLQFAGLSGILWDF